MLWIGYSHRSCVVAGLVIEVHILNSTMYVHYSIFSVEAEANGPPVPQRGLAVNGPQHVAAAPDMCPEWDDHPNRGKPQASK